MLSLRQDGRLSVLRVLVGLNILIFLFTLLLSPMGVIRFEGFFGLSMRGISEGMIWQFVTHQFLHGSLFHLLVNMLGLWFAGRILENLLGGWKFLLFYLTCGIFGGIFQLLLAPGPVLIGASGAVCGVVAAFSALYPEMQISVLLFFVLPLRMRAKWLGRIIVTLSLFFVLTGLMGNVGNAAHLGGALAGYAIVWLGKPRRRSRI